MRALICMFFMAVLVGASLSAAAQGNCTPGREEWVTACDKLSTFGSWEGPREGVETCTWNPPPGWVIVDHQVEVHSSNNGSRSVSTIAANSNFISERSLKSAFQSLMDVAAEHSKSGQQAKFHGALQQQYARQLEEIQKYQATHNTLHATVRASAHGNEIFDRKRGWEEISVRARVRCLGSPNVQLYKQTIAKQIGMPLGYQIAVNNKCSVEAKFALHYKKLSGEWRSVGWYSVPAGARRTLRSDGAFILSNNMVFYYYAKMSTGPAIDGDQYVSLNGEGWMFRKYVKERGSDDVYEVALCEDYVR